MRSAGLSSALRIAFAGTPEFALPALQALLGSGHAVVGVLTQPDRPKGRGRRLSASPVKLAALAAGTPVLQPETLKSEEAQAALAAWCPDLMVVVAYGLILPPAVLGLPHLGCVNIHASLLPRWRGAAPIQRAILAGDDSTGISIMQMDAGLDTGPILLRRATPMSATDTSRSLHQRLAELGARTLLEALAGLAGDALHSEAQPQEGASYARKIDKAEAVIDWQRSAVDIERAVRAFDPWPVAETSLEGEQLRVIAATIPGERCGSSLESNRPGAVVAVTGQAIVVQCGNGILAITQLQRPGRRPVAAGDFARSRASLLGIRLG